MDLEKFKTYYNDNSPFLNLIGATLIELKEGYAVSTLEPKIMHNNINLTVHGGVLFTLADATAGAAAKSYGNATTTLEGKINYIKSATADDSLVTAIAKTIHHGRKTTVIQCDVYNQDKKILITSTFTMYNLDKKN